MKKLVTVLVLALAVCALLPALASAQTADVAKDTFLHSLKASAEPAWAALGDLTGVPAPTDRVTCADCAYTYFHVCVPSCAPGDFVCRGQCSEDYDVCRCNSGCGMQFCR